MHRSIFTAMVLLIGSAGAWAAEADAVKPTFSDTAIDAAIKKGVEVLWTKQLADGSWGPYTESGYDYLIGPTAIATYALLESGASAQDPRMVKAIDWLTAKAEAQIAAAAESPPKAPVPMTYEFGLLCNVYYSANRGTNNKYSATLEKIAKYVWSNCNPRGSYDYILVKPADPNSNYITFDQSNSQYGLLGVWAAALDNQEVPAEYWLKVMTHWMDTQCADGSWAYRQLANQGTASMTAAGLASMFVCFDNYFTDAFVAVNSNKEFKPIEKALVWFDKNFVDSMDAPGNDGRSTFIYYYYYGIERVGLASGYKYFGSADWYKLISQRLLAGQNGDGSWGKSIVVDTSYALLFLIRGRAPILFNKLEYPGDWRNRPRDLAMVSRWLTRQFETALNWQIINLKAAVNEWHDAPILYIAGSTEPKLTPEDINNLKTYIQQGGTILAVTEGNGPGFSTGIKNLAAKMFPQYTFGPCPADHELLSKSLHYDLKGKLRVNLLSNGVRPLLIHVENDVSRSWQMQDWGTQKQAFEIAGNIYLYVTDNGAGLRPRGTTPWPEKSAAAATASAKIVRLKHEGNWDPEPLALERFKLLMGNLYQVNIEIAEPIDIAALTSCDAKLAVLTGIEALTLKDEDKAAIQKYISNGGTVVIDAAGGSKAFAQSAREAIDGMYGIDGLRLLANSSPIYQVKGLEIDKPKYRRRSRTRMGKEFGLRAVLVDGERPGLIYSAEDLTVGLLGCACFGIDGYDVGDGNDPGMCFQLMRNIVLNAAKITVTPPATATTAAPVAQ